MNEKKYSVVFALETSCDETAGAVVRREEEGIRVISSVVASQADTHRRTHGVVPEVAARSHAESLPAVMRDALEEGCGSREQAKEMIDAIVVTETPGLEPALVTGRMAARALAVAWDKPLIKMNHCAGHIAAAWLLSGSANAIQHAFPSIALLVSGGHTDLYRLDAQDDDGITAHHLGGTRDDAAGEAFDKIARTLGLPYPGGPALSALAKKGNPNAYKFPRPMERSGTLDMSFSGLKTAIKNHVADRSLTEQERADVAASAQEAICDVLTKKTVAAVTQEGAKEIILTGGVASNERLREKLATQDVPLCVPDKQYCTDNAAMIGAAALLNVQLVE